ncbi:MAG: response regulator transcription factor [Nitriliruptorales bacterium]|nr:response regulator transcription factor [Nitriliruptorales bacterium]
MTDPVEVVVVDDEQPLVDLVTGYLEREGFRVHPAYEGEQALEVIAGVDPDVIVLDLMLPGVDGLEVARRVRTFSDAYIIMLTAKAEEVDRIVGLSVGADDYLTKPFSPRELVARVQAMLRRPRVDRDEPEPGVRAFGELIVDPTAREVTVSGEAVELTKLEFDLLDTLTAHPRQVFTREQLLERVWGSADFRDEHVVAVHIANLRRKLGDDPEEPVYIRTIRGVGYRMAEP